MNDGEGMRARLGWLGLLGLCGHPLETIWASCQGSNLKSGLFVARLGAAVGSWSYLASPSRQCRLGHVTLASVL